MKATDKQARAVRKRNFQAGAEKHDHKSWSNEISADKMISKCKQASPSLREKYVSLFPSSITVRLN